MQLRKEELKRKLLIRTGGQTISKRFTPSSTSDPVLFITPGFKLRVEPRRETMNELHPLWIAAMGESSLSLSLSALCKNNTLV